MSHIAEDPTAVAPPGAAGWVRCRSRTWQVLAAHRDGAYVQWQLARPDDLPRLLVAPPDVVRPVPIVSRQVSGRRWAHGVRSCVNGDAPIWWPRHAAALPIDRVPLQYVPAMALLSGHHRRLLLADAVGMGKTVQAAILLREIHAREPEASTLIVTPAALLDQWRRELHRRAFLDAITLDATALRREAARPPAVVRASRIGVCSLISIDLLRQPEIVALFTSMAWTLLVVDEAHLAAPGTARLAAVARVAAVSVRVLLLTATPTAAGAAGAAALRALGARQHEGAMSVLRRAQSSGEPRRVRVLRVRPDRSEAALHRRLDRFVARARAERGAAGLLPALVLRRRASSCPAAVVRSLERRLEVLGSGSAPHTPGLFDASPASDADALDDWVMGVEAWADSREERQEIERLLALARTCEPAGRKAAAVARLLARCGEPAVVFTAYVDTLRQLRAALSGIAVVVVHGHTPDALRTSAIAEFTEGRAAVLLTTDASAEGLNLHTRCRLVVHADVPASARLFEQRTGRVDRYGQQRRVHAVLLATACAQDDEALERVEARQGEDAQWVAAVETARCRRTDVAARRLATSVPSDMSGEATPPRILCHRLRPARWRRATSCLGVDASARFLVVGTLTTSGDAMLSQETRPLAFAGPPGAPPMSMTELALLGAELGGGVRRRAWHRIRRLAGWERATALALEAEAPHRRAPGLFDDAAGGKQPDAHRAWQDREPSAAFSVAAVLERRS